MRRQLIPVLVALPIVILASYSHFGGELSPLELLPGDLTLEDSNLQDMTVNPSAPERSPRSADGPKTLHANQSESILRPSSRSEYGMAYDAESDLIVLFGGRGNDALGDTWAYDVDTNEWVSMQPSAAPSPRFLVATAYDIESDRVILFGGVSDLTLSPLGDTWAYDLNTNTWANMAPMSQPPARWGRMAYDRGSDRVVLFGGASGHTDSGLIFNDTWAYDFNGNTWTEMSPRPLRSTSHGMAYDLDADRILVFGGEQAPFQPAEGTWAYNFDNDTWEERGPLGVPPSAIHYTMAYDSESHRTMLWGGETLSFSFVDEVWEYDFPNDTWTSRGPTAGPSPRNIHRAVHDADSDRLVTFGGRWPRLASPNNETWAYDLNSNAWTPLIVPPSEPRNLQAVEGEVRVDLSWTAPSAEGSHPITGYQIYRRSTGGSAPLAKVDTVPAFADTNVTVGTTYTYHVNALNAAGEGEPSDTGQATPFDATAPLVAISLPVDGAMLTAVTVEVAGTASDNVAVEKVEMSLDGTNWILAFGTTTWSGTLTLQEGSNTIHVRATDASDNVNATNISVTVELPSADGEDTGGGGVPPWLIGAILAAVAGAAVVTVLLFRRRRG